jgi:hypothetical protein
MRISAKPFLQIIECLLDGMEFDRRVAAILLGNAGIKACFLFGCQFEGRHIQMWKHGAEDFAAGFDAEAFAVGEGAEQRGPGAGFGIDVEYGHGRPRVGNYQGDCSSAGRETESSVSRGGSDQAGTKTMKA